VEVLFLKTAKKTHVHGADRAQGERKVHEEHGSRSHHEQAHGEKRPAKKLDSGRLYLVISIVVMVALLGIIIYLLPKSNPEKIGASLSGAPNQGYTGTKAKVEFYVMSQCPYGTQVEEAIYPVLQKLGNAVDFQLNFIAKEASPGVFQSLHGAKEVQGDIAQLCVNSYYPAKLMDFIICQNKDVSNLDKNWESCGKSLGMDTAKISSCLNSDEGKNLLRTSISRSNARQAQGSPTIYFNDVKYAGGRQSIDFQRAICQTVKSPECENIPACSQDTDCAAQPAKEGYCTNPGQQTAKCEYKDPVKVNYVILNDDKCTDCDTTNLVQATQQLFLGASPRLVDVKSAEGKALVQKYSVSIVPAFIFDSGITQTSSWKKSGAQLQNYFDTLSDGKYKLKDTATGATYFIDENARTAYLAEQAKLNKEKADALGVVTGDNKPQIDFFVMSYCPYGNQAEEGIAPAYNLLKGKAIFNPRYVIYANYGGGGPDYCLGSGKYCSMHGIQELNQDVREICVNKYFGVDSWFKFALAMNKNCTSQNADSCWENVAKGLGLDTAKIKSCQGSEAEALLKAEQALGDKLSVQGSPTVFVDGAPYAGGRNPDDFKTAICSAFATQPSECSTKLAGPSAGAAAAPAGGCGG
jgi:predicted DsbA family dithiol-disulfide isomerase